MTNENNIKKEEEKPYLALKNELKFQSKKLSVVMSCLISLYYHYNHN